MKTPNRPELAPSYIARSSRATTSGGRCENPLRDSIPMLVPPFLMFCSARGPRGSHGPRPYHLLRLAKEARAFKINNYPFGVPRGRLIFGVDHGGATRLPFPSRASDCYRKYRRAPAKSSISGGGFVARCEGVVTRGCAIAPTAPFPLISIVAGRICPLRPRPRPVHPKSFQAKSGGGKRVVAVRPGFPTPAAGPEGTRCAARSSRCGFYFRSFSGHSAGSTAPRPPDRTWRGA